MQCFGRFVGRLFHHVLEDPESKSTLVNSLSVCISLLDPKRAASVAAAGAARGQHVTEPVTTANPETVEGMLQRLGEIVELALHDSLFSVINAVEGEVLFSKCSSK